MRKNLISVIIPCYNGEKYLEQCFSSLLNQTYKNIEVIIINDGSIDKTNDIIDKYIEIGKEKNIEIKKFSQKNSGQAVAINLALKYVEGQFLVWQDCDDYYEYDALENMVGYLKQHPDMDFVRGKSANRDEKNLDIVINEGKSKNPNNSKIFDAYVFETDSYCYPGIFMVRMDFFEKCIKDRKIYESRAGQNWQLILPLAYNGKCGYLDKVVYNYRIVNNSHSHSVKKFRDLIRRCEEHKDILFHVIDELNMSNKELIRYKFCIKIKYFKKKIRIALSKIKSYLVRREKC